MSTVVTCFYRALQSLNTYRSGPCSQLINVLFGVSEPSPPISHERDGVLQTGTECVHSVNKLLYLSLEVSHKHIVNASTP